MKNVILVALFALSSFFGFVNAEVQSTEQAPTTQEQATGEAEGTQKEVPAQEAPAHVEAKEESANNGAEADAKAFAAMMKELDDSQNALSNE